MCQMEKRYRNSLWNRPALIGINICKNEIEYQEHTGDGQMLHEQLAEDAAISGVASQRKPVEKIIIKHNCFFDSLAEITNIHVYGLSVSEADTPYLKHILSIVRSAKWEFSDYKGSNSAKIKSFCENNNIHNYNIIELENIIDTAQLKITFPDL